MEILTLAIQKGGTGKTTTAIAMTQAAAKAGKKVLAIDLDPQANFTFALGVDQHEEFNSYNLLNGAPAEKLIRKTEQGIDIIGASWDLQAIKTTSGSARRLQKAIEPIKKKYDLIVIDTPPTAGELQYNALLAATALLIPMQADTYSIQALYQIMDTARQMQQGNPALKVKGCILSCYDGRSVISKQMMQAITDTAKELGTQCLGVIRKAIAIQEAAALQQSIFEYAPKSKPAQDYINLYKALNI